MASDASPPGDPDPDEFVGYTIVRVASALEQQFRRTLAPEKLSPRQFSVLVHLARTPGISSGALARLVLITPQSMSTLVASLEQSGLLEREADPGPGLPMGVRLTARGRAVLGRAQKRAGEANQRAVAGLTTAEVTQLNRLLHRMLATNEKGR